MCNRVQKATKDTNDPIVMLALIKTEGLMTDGLTFPRIKVSKLFQIATLHMLSKSTTVNGKTGT